jgi:hypothetical protein
MPFLTSKLFVGSFKVSPPSGHSSHSATAKDRKKPTFYQYPATRAPSYDSRQSKDVLYCSQKGGDFERNSCQHHFPESISVLRENYPIGRAHHKDDQCARCVLSQNTVPSMIFRPIKESELGIMPVLNLDVNMYYLKAAEPVSC